MPGKKRLTVVLLSLGLFILIAANSLVYFVRIDLTRSRAFSISPVSRELFREIPERVRITYYVSERLRKLSPVPGRIEDLLYEYAAHGRGKIEVKVLEPEKSDPPLQPESLGIAPQQIQVVERNEQTLATVYTGIIISYLDSRETLPVVFDTLNLEYQLSREIKKLVARREPAVGVLIGRAGSGLASEFSLLADRLSRSYRVRELERGEAIPADLSALLVLGGQDLREEDLLPVDAFVMEGGKVLFAAEGVDIDMDRNLQALPVGDRPLLDLLESYSVEVGRALVLDARCALMPVQRDTGRMLVRSLEKYNHWVSVQGSGFSRTNPLSSGLSSLDLFWPNPLRFRETPGLEAEVLASSSGDSWLMRDRFSTNPYEAPQFRSLAAESRGNYPLALALRGSLASGFNPDIRSRDTRIIVMGNSTAATDLLRYSNSPGNLDFFENAVDWLAGDEDLLEIKTRAARDTGLGRIEDPRVRNALILFSRMVNLIIVPAGLALYGLYRAWRRRRIHGL